MCVFSLAATSKFRDSSRPTDCAYCSLTCKGSVRRRIKGSAGLRRSIGCCMLPSPWLHLSKKLGLLDPGPGFLPSPFVLLKKYTITHSNTLTHIHAHRYTITHTLKHTHTRIYKHIHIRTLSHPQTLVASRRRCCGVKVPSLCLSHPTALCGQESTSSDSTLQSGSCAVAGAALGAAVMPGRGGAPKPTRASREPLRYANVRRDAESPGGGIADEIQPASLTRS